MRFVTVIVVAVLVGPLAVAQEQVPTYKGKPLAYWVKRLQKAETDADQLAAAQAIVRFGADAAPAVPTLAELLHDHSPEFRSLVIDILVKLGHAAQPATPVLVKLIKQRLALTPEMRGEELSPGSGSMIETLASIADANDAVPVLIEVLKQPDLREGALRAICSFGPAATNAIPAIRNVLPAIFDIPEESRLVDENGTPQLDRNGVWIIFVKNDPDFGLHKLGPDILPVLLELLDAPATYAKRCATMEIVALHPHAKSVVPKLTAMLKDKDSKARYYAASALWKLEKSSAVISVLTDLVNDSNPKVVYDAAVLLGEIGPAAEKALPTLKDSFKRKWVAMHPLICSSDSGISPNALPSGTFDPPQKMGKQSQLAQAINAAIKKIEVMPKK